MKRLLYILTFVTISLSLHANGIEIDGVYYLLDEDSKTATVTFTGALGNSSSTYSGDIIVPTAVTYHSVNYLIVAIGDSAFYKCSALTTIVLPDSATTIGKNAFQGCSALTSVHFPKCLKTILDYAFTSCTKLDNVIIPNTVTHVGTQAFGGCKNLKNILLPNSIKTFGNYIFYECSSLKSIILPDSIQNLYVGSFSNCTKLSYIHLPDKLTTLWQSALNKCPLQSLYLPEKLSFINTNVILGDNLSAVYCAAKNPPSWQDETAFYFSTDKTQIDTLYVPWKSVDAYKANAKWSAKFKVIVGQTFGDSETENVTSTTASLKWKPDSIVSQYIINIYTNRNLFATYTVDSLGNVVSDYHHISGNYRMPMDTTKSTTEFYVISLEDLTGATEYNYTIDGTDADGNLVYHVEGTFHTTITIGFATTPSDYTRRCIRKIFRNGQLFILIDDKTYTLSGIEVSQ